MHCVELVALHEVMLGSLQIEQLRTDFDARLAQKESRIAGTEENAVRLQVTNLVEEMRDGLEEQAAE
ncbi:unnamed protein product, partial [Anisakis simplex]|uniref:Cell division protein ZapB n=1 Tax=Anisakis simplex TaxID=6269 RepID=A0A0M3JKR8_ANISI